MYTHIYEHMCVYKHDTETIDNITFQSYGYMVFQARKCRDMTYERMTLLNEIFRGSNTKNIGSVQYGRVSSNN